MMGAYIYGLIYTILYVLLGKLFMETFGCVRRSESRLFRGLLLTGMMGGMYAISVFLNGNWVLKEICVLLVSIVFMCGYFRINVVKSGILMLLYQGLSLAVEYLTMIMVVRCCRTVTEQLLSEPLITALIGMLNQALIFAFILFMHSHIMQKSSDMLTAVEWARFSIFPVFTIVVLIALLSSFGVPLTDIQKNILLVIAFGMIAMNILVYDLIDSILKREMRLREDQLFMERVKSETKRYRERSENFDRQRKREHEFKNQLLVIGELARNNKTEELIGYLNKMNVEIKEKTDVIDTNHVIVNSILNAKYHEAGEKNILFEIKINDLSGIRIEDEDIVLILSNLLNNAIEACANCERSFIRLKFVKEEYQTIISVVNTMRAQPIVEGGHYLTSKTENAQMHGVGIENIRETVEKYNGSCVIKHDDTSFRFAIVIPD